MPHMQHSSTKRSTIKGLVDSKRVDGRTFSQYIHINIKTLNRWLISLSSKLIIVTFGMFPRENPENLVVRRIPTANQAPVHVLYQKGLGVHL
jgi:hypothetical protein